MKDQRSLSGLRLAITMPPENFFGGVDRRRAIDTAEALLDLGATVHRFEVGAAYRQDHDELCRQIDALEEFRADAVIAAPQAGYALDVHTSNVKATVPHDRHNLFLDILNLPVFLYWDHVIPQLPRYLTSRWPADPSESTGGLLGRMRRLLQHANAISYFPDSGHIATLKTLEVAEFSLDRCFITSIPRAFVSYGDRHDDVSRTENQVAFFGNLYMEASRRITYPNRSDLLGIRERAIAALASDWKLAPYNAYINVLESSDQAWRSRLHLEPDQTFYWKFLFDELSVVANGELRLQKMQIPGQSISYFGGFADASLFEPAKEAGWVAHGNLPYGEALAAQYKNTCVSIDIVNAPFISGFSPKLFECYAAGGFMLTDRRADISAAIGELGELIGFSSPDELAGKVDRFLTRERERREVISEIREIVARQYTASSLLARTIPAGLSCLHRTADSNAGNKSAPR